MNNSQNNLSEFEDFLKRHCLIRPEKARFYIYWVERFLKYYQHRPSKPLDQIVASYLDKMEADSRFADWQVKPDKIKESLKSHLQRIKQMHDQDLAKGYGGTTLPDALEKKYPQATKNGPGNGCSPRKAWCSIP